MASGGHCRENLQLLQRKIWDSCERSQLRDTPPTTTAPTRSCHCRLWALRVSFAFPVHGVYRQSRRTQRRDPGLAQIWGRGLPVCSLACVGSGDWTRRNPPDQHDLRGLNVTTHAQGRRRPPCESDFEKDTGFSCTSPQSSARLGPGPAQKPPQEAAQGRRGEERSRLGSRTGSGLLVEVVLRRCTENPASRPSHGGGGLRTRISTHTVPDACTHAHTTSRNSYNRRVGIIPM